MLITPPADLKTSTVYLDWVHANAPDWVPDAEELLKYLNQKIGSPYLLTESLLKDLERRARKLPREHLPWYWDTAAHRLSGRAARLARKAHASAREAEREHRLPVDPHCLHETTLLLAKAGALAGKDVSAHQRWLADTRPREEAHREFMRLLEACAAGKVAPSSDLGTRLRTSAKGAGLGVDEEARVLGVVLATAQDTDLPGKFLDDAARVFGSVEPDNELKATLAELFPTSNNDGAAWLRLLKASGTIEAMAHGWVTPSCGFAGWLSRFAFMYCEHRSWRSGKRLPDELFEVLPRLAPRIRASETPVRLHEGRRRNGTSIDAELADACVAEGIRVEDPGEDAEFKQWKGASRRDMRALAADPVLGPRFEGASGTGLAQGTAISRLPDNTGIEESVRERVAGLTETVARGGLGAAREAMRTLDTLLDQPTAAALDGIHEVLAELDLVHPLWRTLRAGLPVELGWAALDEAVAELTAGDGRLHGVTSTWPVLTVFSQDRAIAIDHEGRRASCEFSVPADGVLRSVHYVDGDFLIGWRKDKTHPEVKPAYWSSRPDEVFEPRRTAGIAPLEDRWAAVGFGYQPATAGGRHDGEIVLRPGRRDGIGAICEHLSDGTRLWSSTPSPFWDHKRRRHHWIEVDPATGKPVKEGVLPEFFTSAEPLTSMAWAEDLLSLARLPEQVTGSPLGQVDGLSGFRVFAHPTTDRFGNPDRYTLEGIDGRRASYDVRERTLPWGIARLPEGGPDVVVTQDVKSQLNPMSGRDAEDGSLLWTARSFSGLRSKESPKSEWWPVVPPPAFWHFLVPRDAVSSRALRGVGREAVRALLRAARTAPSGDDGRAIRDALARVLPEVTEPRIVDGVVFAVEQAAEVLALREETSRRVEVVLSGALVRPSVEIPDNELLRVLQDLLGIRHVLGFREPSPRSATLTALVADGRYLCGEIDDRVRRLSPPAVPQDWTPLLGNIDLLAWRALVATTTDEDRVVLTAFLRVWAEQPFARPGAWRRGVADGAALAPLCAAGHAAVTGVVGKTRRPDLAAGRHLDPEGSYRFVQRADAPEPSDMTDVEVVSIARDDAARLRRLLALLDRHGPIPPDEQAHAAFTRRTGTRRATGPIVLAGMAEAGKASAHAASYTWERVHALALSDRCRVQAAAIPDDPAELWAAGGAVAAAERMAEVWVELLGAERPVDEDLAAHLERDLDSGHVAAAAFATPSGPFTTPPDPGSAPLVDAWESLRLTGGKPDHVELASLLVWALTHRPVGDPATSAVPELHDRLRARFRDPDLTVSLGGHFVRADQDECARVSGTNCPLIIQSERPYTYVRLRPSRLADKAARRRLMDFCRDNDMPDLAVAVHRFEVIYDGGLARMVERAADTPVPPGGYEANPLFSVPRLVERVAGDLGVDHDAAALFLQLLTLADPTDRNVRTWNGWTAARQKAVQSTLVELGAVREDKRPRAGRTAFIHGEWTKFEKLMFRKDHLPVETAKLAPHLVVADGWRKRFTGPFTRMLPPAPLHEMFVAAWVAR